MPFAPAFSQVSTLLADNITYTTYSLNPNATNAHDGIYGQSAYAVLWANLSYSTATPFTTTLETTPVPSGELVFPPRLYDLFNTSETPEYQFLGLYLGCYR